MAVVHIPALLHSLTGNVRKQEVEGQTVGDLIDQLELLYPGIKRRLLVNGRIRSGLAIFVDGMVRREGLEYEVKPESEVLFVPAVAGGCTSEAGFRNRKSHPVAPLPGGPVS